MRIILIDDDQLVTLSLKTILESTGSVQVLATGTSGAEAIALYQQWKPDVLLLDIQMPNGSGLDAGEQILQQDPNARILFLTTFSDDAYIAKALELGAKGYLLKQDFAGIVPALEAVMQGQHVFGEQVVSCFSKQFKKKSTFDYAKYDIRTGNHCTGCKGIQQQGNRCGTLFQRGNNSELSQQHFGKIAAA